MSPYSGPFATPRSLRMPSSRQTRITPTCGSRVIRRDASGWNRTANMGRERRPLTVEPRTGPRGSPTGNSAGESNWLKKPTELLRGQASPPHDDRHGVRVHWVVTGDRHNMFPVGHDDVLALPNHPESSPRQRPDCAKMRNPRGSPFLSLKNDFPLFASRGQFFSDLQVAADGVPDVFESLLLGMPLRSAAGQPGHPNAVALFGLPQRNAVARFPREPFGGGGGSRTRVRESPPWNAYVRSRLLRFGARFRAGKNGARLARLISACGYGPKPSAYPA